MRDIFKCVALFTVGLLMSAVVYPLLHEAGHSIVALTIGAKVREFSLFPLPYVVCQLSSGDKVSEVFIGLGGILMPYLLSMQFRAKSFWLWYANLLIKSISVYASLLSATAIILRNFGVSWQDDDVIQVLSAFPNGDRLLLLMLITMSIYGIANIISDKPLQKCVSYFGLQSLTENM